MLGVKARSPLAIILLYVVTIGLYFLFWFYRVNKEAALIANDRRARPGVSLLAVTLGALLIIPPFRSMYTTAQRVGAATRSWPGTGENLFFSVLFPLLFPLSVVVYTCWVQGMLNGHVRMREAQQAQLELMQRAQVRVVGVQADIERERSIHSW
jgi:Domain of unknown function (DUF4234)